MATKANQEPRYQKGTLVVGLLLAVLIVAQLANHYTGGILRNEFANIFASTASGEWWRLFTAQFLHLDLFHVIEDTACIAVVWWLLNRDFTLSPSRFLVVFVLSGTLGQVFALWAWRLGLTDAGSLVGSSDALHGMIYLYVRGMYDHSPAKGTRLLWLLALSALLASVLYTCFTGVMIYSSALKSPGYNHFGGILGFAAAVEVGWLRLVRRGNHES